MTAIATGIKLQYFIITEKQILQSLVKIFQTFLSNVLNLAFEILITNRAINHKHINIF